MKRTLLVTAAAAVATIFLGTSMPAYAEEDACAGQSWPNLSDDCITQIVKKVCEAGGGGDCTGGESTSVSRRQFNKFAVAPESATFVRKNGQLAR